MADTETKFILAIPVPFMGQTYTELSARRPKVKDLRLISGPKVGTDPIGAQNDFLGSLCGVPPALFDELDIDDLEQFTDYTDSFLKKKKQPAT